jgi:hypothetical protein
MISPPASGASKVMWANEFLFMMISYLVVNWFVIDSLLTGRLQKRLQNTHVKLFFTNSLEIGFWHIFSNKLARNQKEKPAEDSPAGFSSERAV